MGCDLLCKFLNKTFFISNNFWDQEKWKAALYMKGGFLLKKIIFGDQNINKQIENLLFIPPSYMCVKFHQNNKNQTLPFCEIPLWEQLLATKRRVSNLIRIITLPFLFYIIHEVETFIKKKKYMNIAMVRKSTSKQKFINY